MDEQELSELLQPSVYLFGILFAVLGSVRNGVGYIKTREQFEKYADGQIHAQWESCLAMGLTKEAVAVEAKHFLEVKAHVLAEWDRVIPPAEHPPG